MATVQKPNEQFAIISEADRPPAPVRVLKHGDSFAVFNPRGDIDPSTGAEQGLYYDGTRFLSRFELRLASRQPLLLSSTISEDNAVFTADLTNPDVVKEGRVAVTRGHLHLFRSRVLSQGSWIECLRVTNHALHSIETALSIHFDADFADIFEVRGNERQKRGRRLPPPESSDIVLRYLGLDQVERRTRIRSREPADRVDEDGLTFAISLEPHAYADLELTISCELDDQRAKPESFQDVVTGRRQRAAVRDEQSCRLTGSNDAFNRWVRRSTSDLRMMITDTDHGPYPYAGIPWFSTPFGRDGIITALERLWAAPDLARGVLAFLAETQATTRDDARDAQPGKILHEMRGGEMAALNEVPFGRYYGSADATPLFVVLAHAYYERTGDLTFIERIWPHVTAALEWMDRDGDLDRDGFIEYQRQSATGLVQQGWKDSWDSVFHADGSLAEAPIALSEIQGYAYAAWRGAAQLAAARDDGRHADAWNERAATLQARFDKAFWCDDLGTYALALDGTKRPCRVAASNAGHCLFTGIANRARAPLVAAALMSDQSFGGWGVRTVAAGAARYNPMSYHNGSVWPHDNAIVAAGLAKYGFTGDAARITNAMFDLSQAVDLNRLPELICGFHRRAGDSPTLYPVACAPQAWAAGAVYLLVQACLGLQVQAMPARVSFSRAALPESIESLQILNLSVASATVDLHLTRHSDDVSVTVVRRKGTVEIVATK